MKKSLQLGLILLSAILFSVSFYSKRIWADEVLSYYLITDPSFLHSKAAQVSNIDGNPPLFHYVFWWLYNVVWSDLYFLKVASGVLFFGGIYLFADFTARHFDNRRFVFFVFLVLAAFSVKSYNLVYQLRTYSMYFFLSAVLLILTQELIYNRKPMRLLQYGVVAFALAMTHNYGLFVVNASLAYLFLVFLFTGKKEMLMACVPSVLTTLLWYLLWYDNMVIQSDCAKPHTWMPPVTFRSAVTELAVMSPVVLLLSAFKTSYAFLLFVGASFVTLFAKRSLLTRRTFLQDRAFQVFLMSIVVCYAVEGAAILASVLKSPILYFRYLWPLNLVMIYQAIYMLYTLRIFQTVGEWFTRMRWLPVLAYSGLFAVAFACFWGGKWLKEDSSFRLDQYEAKLSKELPVVYESSLDYLVENLYNTERKHYFVLDWTSSVDKRSPLGQTVEYKVMDGIKKYYHVPSIIYRPEFSKKNFNRFYVITRTNVILFNDLIDRKVIKVEKVIDETRMYRVLECSFI